MTGTTVFINGIPHVIEIVEKPDAESFIDCFGYYNVSAYNEAMQQYQKAIEPIKVLNAHYFKAVKKYGCKMKVLTPDMTVEFDRWKFHCFSRNCIDGGAVITKIN